MTPEEIIENAEKMRAGETAMPLDPLERRVFRLETQNTQNTAEIAEVKDRLKNAHHRIDETQRDLQEFRTETRENFKNINTKLDNLGKNMAVNAESNSKTMKKIFGVLLIVGVIALAAFIGMFIENQETRKAVGEVAVRVATATATTVL